MCCGTVDGADDSRRLLVTNRWQLDVFWRRWTLEYMTGRQQRTKWMDPQVSLKKGDVVLVKDDGLPRGQWPLGRIIDVSKSRDGLARSVTVLCRGNKYLRPVTRLCLLEAD